MQNLINKSQLTMSSKEIAEMTDKQHKHVIRDIREMLEGIEGPNLDPKEYQEVRAPNGMTAEILLNYRLCTLLITGYSVPHRLKVIDRWQELEEQVSVPTITDPNLRAIMQLVIETDQAKQLAISAQGSAERANARLDQLETASDHFTIVGWGRYTKRPSIPLPEAAIMGKQATQYCFDKGIEMGDVPDARYGRVKTYPKWVLDFLFSE
jgi:phage regulator Rha-like protein